MFLFLQIHCHKFAFNQRLLALRDQKIRDIARMTELVGELNAVQSQLQPGEVKLVPTIPHMDLCETPEK